jgi:hypothetical protein
MRQATSNRTTQGRGIAPLAAAALTAAVSLTIAAPASARNDFQNGFEDQLGRIAAHAAVDVGLQVLHGGYYPVVPVPVAPPVYYAPSYASNYGYGHGDYYNGPRKLVVKYPKHRHHYQHDRHYRGYDDRRARHYNQRKHPVKRHDRHYGKRHGKRHDGYRNDDRDRRGRNW